MNFRVQKLNGKLNINWGRINTYASRWKDGTWFDIDIVRKQDKKSDPMRKYYFGAVLPPFMNKVGYEYDEEIFFHHQLKVVYFQYDKEYNVYQDKRGIWRNVPSVFSNNSDMAVLKKKEFVDWVIRKAAQEGVYIPDPA